MYLSLRFSKSTRGCYINALDFGGPQNFGGVPAVGSHPSVEHHTSGVREPLCILERLNSQLPDRECIDIVENLKLIRRFMFGISLKMKARECDPASDEQVRDRTALLPLPCSRSRYHDALVRNQLFEGLGAHASGCHPSPGFPCFTFHGFSVCFSFCNISSANPFPGPSPLPRTVVPSTSPSPTPSSKLPRRGVSRTEGFAAQRSSAARARCLSSCCLVTSACCSKILGGSGLE